MHGQLYKAAIVRHASGLFRNSTWTYFRDGSRLQQYIHQFVVALDEIYAIMYSSGTRFLDDESIALLQQHVEAFGICYMWCRELSRQENLLAFNVTSKVHKVMHIPRLSMIINRAFMQNCGEESMVGTTVRVWKAAKHGRYRRNIQHVVLLRRLLGLFMRMEGFE